MSETNETAVWPGVTPAQAAFLDELARGSGLHYRACEAAGVHPVAPVRWASESEVFAEAYKEAKGCIALQLIDIGVRHCMESADPDPEVWRVLMSGLAPDFALRYEVRWVGVSLGEPGPPPDRDEGVADELDQVGAPRAEEDSELTGLAASGEREYAHA